jgi:hypothetical protein
MSITCRLVTTHPGSTGWEFAPPHLDGGDRDLEGADFGGAVGQLAAQMVDFGSFFSRHGVGWGRYVLSNSQSGEEAEEKEEEIHEWCTLEE